jgi:imidazolonepropionase-like amidohydrolase
MKNLPLFFSLIFCLSISSPSLALPPIAFTNVNVIPMNTEQVLENQVVLIEDGKIKTIGKNVKLPQNTQIIDAKGQYLIPGLVDMHAHLYADNPQAFPEKYAPNELQIMLALGTTTARLMAGNPMQLKLKAQSANNEILAPRLFVSSPEFSGKKYYKEFRGFEVSSPEKAAAAVRQAKAEGYDFIKMTMLISLPVYEAVTKTAKELGIRVVGHINSEVKVKKAIESGQQIEHLDEYMEALLPENAPNDKIGVSGYGIWKAKNWETMDYVDEKKIAEIVAFTKKHQVYNSPTNAFFTLAFGQGLDSAQVAQLPDFKYIPKSEHEKIFQSLKFYHENVRQSATEERRKKFIDIRRKLIKSLYENGCKLLAGSDCPSWFMGYGFTLHRELAQFVAAGLSPFAALQTATTTPAEFLKISQEIGTIEKGKTADLILLSANPLQNIQNTEKIVGVMSKGKWLNKNDLDKMLTEAELLFR